MRRKFSVEILLTVAIVAAAAGWIMTPPSPQKHRHSTPSCETPSPLSTPPIRPEAPALQVYRALLSQSNLCKGGGILIVNRTLEQTNEEDQEDKQLFDSLPPLQPSTVKRFKEIRKQSLSVSLDGHVMIGPESLKFGQPMSREDWSRVADPHPRTVGFIQFTAVGFSDDQRQALFAFCLFRGRSDSKSPGYLVDYGLALLEKGASWELIKTAQFSPAVNWGTR